MRFTSAFGAVATFVAVASAQTNPGDASDADVAIVAQQLSNVGVAALNLDYAVTNFTGPSSGPALQSSSNDVVTALTNGISNIQPVQGNITITQGVQQLLTPTNLLNSNVTAAVNDTINRKQLLVDSCYGPTVLSTLNQQYNLSLSFRDAIASKFAESNRGLVTSLAAVNRSVELRYWQLL
ncbi:hypothetical protein AMS68_006123 [Peltaster fructicola]|uniref:Uncharacterized protein n=1 Tax=Peltaster fructicola TaxID=286661 RepID=A0A6H0Y0Z8_9PEZI|nr:hypothetical protein AMS68_006123 [Peltaster fructicola]